MAQGVDSVPKVGYRAQHRTECGIGVMAYVLRRYPQGLFAVKMECFAVVDCWFYTRHIRVILVCDYDRYGVVGTFACFRDIGVDIRFQSDSDLFATCCRCVVGHVAVGFTQDCLEVDIYAGVGIGDFVGHIERVGLVCRCYECYWRKLHTVILDVIFRRLEADVVPVCTEKLGLVVLQRHVEQDRAVGRFDFIDFVVCVVRLEFEVVYA